MKNNWTPEYTAKKEAEWMALSLEEKRHTTNVELGRILGVSEDWVRRRKRREGIKATKFASNTRVFPVSEVSRLLSMWK